MKKLLIIMTILFSSVFVRMCYSEEFTWARYESYCFFNGLEPSYEEYCDLLQNPQCFGDDCDIEDLLEAEDVEENSCSI